MNGAIAVAVSRPTTISVRHSSGQLPDRLSLQEPHAGPSCGAGSLLPTAKTDSCLSSSRLPQEGQDGTVDDWTINSNFASQPRQAYSKIGKVYLLV